MHHISQLIECCTEQVAPVYFLSRLKKYAELEAVTLATAAETILPFAQLYNRVELTTLLGCILKRPELISPALSFSRYRNAFLEAAHAFPELNLESEIPFSIIKPLHKITKAMVRLFNQTDFIELLEAHCGLRPFTGAQKWLAHLLKADDQHRAFLLEDYIERAGLTGLPLQVDQQLKAKTFLKLSREHQINFIRLIAAADRLQNYIDEFEEIIKHFQRHEGDYQCIMDLIASDPTTVLLLQLRLDDKPELMQFLAYHGWVDSDEPEQIHRWLLAQLILKNPINNLEGVLAKEKQLQRLVKHPWLALRYDNAEQIEKAFQTFQLHGHSILVTPAHLQQLSLAITTDETKLKKLYSQESFHNLLIAIKKNKKTLLIPSLVAIVINELLQLIFYSASNYRFIQKITCDNITLSASPASCITCGYFTETFTHQAVPKKYLFQNADIQAFLGQISLHAFITVCEDDKPGVYFGNYDCPGLQERVDRAYQRLNWPKQHDSWHRTCDSFSVSCHMNCDLLATSNPYSKFISEDKTDYLSASLFTLLLISLLITLINFLRKSCFDYTQSTTNTAYRQQTQSLMTKVNLFHDLMDTPLNNGSMRNVARQQAQIENQLVVMDNTMAHLKPLKNSVSALLKSIKCSPLMQATTISSQTAADSINQTPGLTRTISRTLYFYKPAKQIETFDNAIELNGVEYV